MNAVKYKLQDLIDIDQFQSLQDKLNEINSFPSAIIDNDGNVLTATAWQDICTKFHRIHPKSEKECIISDQYILDHIQEANPAVSYQCPHGLIDNAIPIIIEGVHYGNFFTGQFFLAPPDMDFFQRQAVQYGFDEEAYLEAISKVPVWSKEQLNSYLFFIQGLIELITGVGLKNLKERETQAALQKSEALYHDLVETAQDLIWQCDSEGRYTYLNPAWEQVFGYTVEEMLGKKFSDFQTQEWAERDSKEFTRLMEGNAVKGLESVHIGKDGREIHLIFNAKFLVDVQGKISGTRGTAFDITDRKKAEEILKENEERLRMIIDSVPFGAHLYEMRENKQLIFIGANKAADDILQTDNSQFIGKSLEEAFPALINTEIPEAYRRVATTGEGFSIEQVDYDENGIRGAFDVHAVQTSHKRMAAFFSDITERKKAEMELKLAKEKAEESDRLKTAFLANMSHEIRTPMNGILGFAEILKESDITGEEHDKYLGIIEKSGQRMLHLLNNLIDISKIESGQMEVVVSEVNMSELIQHVISYYQPEAERRGLKLINHSSLSKTDSVLFTDREKMGAVLSNLVTNALKYTPKGSIEVGSKRVGDFMEIFVKDTGIGIAPNRTEVIFDRFVQADLSDSDAKEGAGLGLSITKAYLEMLGGKIWIESEVGKGSIFYFQIPYRDENEVSNINDIEMNTQVVGPKKDLKILIAEDDEPSEMFINVIVKPYGKEVLKVKTGTGAVDVCSENPDVDLVLMDIKMPTMNGYDATRKIREFNKDVVIIAQTAYGLQGDREKALEAGCNDYISKPFKKRQLLEVMSKHFNNKL